MHNKNPFNQKISPEFATRLDRLQPQQKVRIIVFLQVGESANPPGRRQSGAERQAAMEAIRNSARQALERIGDIIKSFGGQPLAENPNVLGCIPVEIPAAGVNALAESDSVKALMEDQTIHAEEETNKFYT
jgi:sorbitol-specific phosphotransferase system component IIA